jgi:hypothetical protein
MAHWYLKRSTINTNKPEAERIAKDLLSKKLWKKAVVKSRPINGHKGYWIEVSN